ncbi:MAG: ABC transporter ATP-binding protein [Chitinivibrionales bacterium]|nr:ABC transporter ATP-binding protein [Chitinivibrionales bacterium]
MPLAINCTDIKKNYAGEHALGGVGFSAETGAMFGLIGADGAGKTTLMRILSTLISPDGGSAEVLGNSIAGPIGRIRSAVGYMPQRFSLYQDLSVAENLNFFADVFSVTGADKKNQVEKLMHFSRLAPFKQRRARNLSGGMKQKLALSCALIHKPRLLLLDEPTTGVDPVSRNEFWRLLAELRRDDITILVSTPYMDEAALCDCLLLLDKGKTLLSGAPAELLKGYPYRLYRLLNRAGTLTCPQDTPLPAGIVLMYPEAGSLHVATAPDFSSPDSVLAAVKNVVPEAEIIDEIPPTIEDLFFMTLSEKNKTKI